MAPSKKLLPAILAVAIAAQLGSIPSVAQVDEVGPVCAPPTRSISLFADDVGTKGKIGYGLTATTATVPGPTIEMNEGECVAITLVNNADARVGFHAHGVDYTVSSDGTPLNASCVRPGRSRTYVIGAHLPATRTDGTVDPGSAGYFHYHDHCMGTPHGTLGLEKGLFGALIVRRAGDPLPDRPPYVVVMGPGSKINLKKAPNTPFFKANQGERVEFVVIGHGNEFHTFHLHGHRWSDTRTGLVKDPADPSAIIDNKTLGPADSFGFQVVAGERVGPGAWMYHCHVQFHSDSGMVGLFLVRTPDGQITPQEEKAKERFRRQEGGHHP